MRHYLKIEKQNLVSWIFVTLLFIVSLYDLLKIDHGHFDRDEIMNSRFIEAILFFVSFVFTLRQLDFEILTDKFLLIIMFLILILFLFISSLVWETKSTTEIGFQGPDRNMEYLHIFSLSCFILIKIYISLVNKK